MSRRWAVGLVLWCSAIIGAGLWLGTLPDDLEPLPSISTQPIP